MRVQMTGYSKTPLVKKLGIKPGFRIVVKGEPMPYTELVAGLSEATRISSRFGKNIDLVHLFVTEKTQLDALLGRAAASVFPAGMIWVSWPKKGSGVPSTVTENTIRELCFPHKLVDVKVCAVDETWSGLKLVFRKEHR